MTRPRKLTLVLVAAMTVVMTPLFARMEEPNYPQVVDDSHATPEAGQFFGSFFAAKSKHDVAATMKHFSPELATYTDATLGWPLDGFDAVEAIFSQYMPKWPASGLSYPTRILGDTRSALVAFTDTPELFGGELRILGAVDFKDGKIVRWVDYWDSSRFDSVLYQKIRTPEDKFPTDFKEETIGLNASPAIRVVARNLQRALAQGDSDTAASMFSYDAVYEDMALRTQLQGRAEIQAYLSRVLSSAPYGKGSRLRHIVGNGLGGGFEWFGSPSGPVSAGITALELDGYGRIIRLTTVYDGRHLRDTDRRSLAALPTETESHPPVVAAR